MVRLMIRQEWDRGWTATLVLMTQDNAAGNASGSALLVTAAFGEDLPMCGRYA
jgi:hypothetical protein